MSTQNPANMDRIGARVVFLLGANADAYTFEVADDRYDKYEIAQAIIETEVEIAHLLAESMHPMRDQKKFMRWLACDHAEAVPEHIGPIEAVRGMCRCGNEKMMEPTSRTNVRLWRENHENIFDDSACAQGLAGYYNLTNGVISFTGDDCEVYAFVYKPTFPDTEAETFGTLQLNAIFEPMLVAGAVAKLGKDGTPPEIIAANAGAYNEGRQALLLGRTYFPRVDAEMRRDNA